MDRSDEYLNCTCEVCGRKFHRKPSHAQRSKRHYCSQQCHYIAKKEYMSGTNNHQYGLKGSLNASWKSDTKVSHYGYIRKRCLDHPFRDNDDFVFEHRLVAEQYMLNDDNSIEIDGKRYLSPEYDVHHINFVRTDNRPENLLVLTAREHKRLHSKLNPRERDAVTGRFVGNKLLEIKRTSTKYDIPIIKNNHSVDLFCCEDEEIIAEPDFPIIVNVGIALKIARGYICLAIADEKIAERMGMDCRTFNTYFDYRDVNGIRICVFNNTNDRQVIKPNERLGTLVLVKPITPELELVSSF